MASAAQHVFEVGELVENILVWLAGYCDLENHGGHIGGGLVHCSEQQLGTCDNAYDPEALDHQIRRKTLFSCRRLNTTCNSAISSSKELQRALYVFPDDKLGPCDAEDSVLAGQAHRHLHHLNTLLVSRRQYYLRSGGWFIVDYPVSKQSGSTVYFQVHNHDPPEGSWRKMYLFNAEFEVKKIVLEWSTPACGYKRLVWIGKAKGMTIGEMFDLAMEGKEE